jgi:hypothetical protein
VEVIYWGFKTSGGLIANLGLGIGAPLVPTGHRTLALVLRLSS